MRSSPVVFFALAYAIARFLLEVLVVSRKPDSQLQSEVLALRHQLRVLEGQVSRTRWRPSDRLLLAAISRALPKPAWRSLLPSPETLLRWHRELVRRKWAAYRRRPGRQRSVPRSGDAELGVAVAEQEADAEFIEHYHQARPHQGLDQRQPYPPTGKITVMGGRVERRDRLGGVLHEYSRAA